MNQILEPAQLKDGIAFPYGSNLSIAVEADDEVGRADSAVAVERYKTDIRSVHGRHLQVCEFQMMS